MNDPMGRQIIVADGFSEPVALHEYQRANQAEVECDVDALAKAVSFVLKDRLCPDKAKYVADYEGRLLASLASLQLICSELREIRIGRAA